MTYDVAIIGYGPTGETLANLLGRGGLRVAVFEKAAEPYDRPRAIGIDHESLRVMQRCGIADTLRPLIEPFRGMVYLGVDGEPIRVLPPVPPPFPLGWSPNATFIQPELEGLLRAAAESRPQVDVFLSHCVRSLHAGPDGVRLEVEPMDGSPRRTAWARYAVGCDGASSTVRRWLGAGIEDLAFDEWWVVVDAWLLDPDAAPSTTRHYCWPARPATFVRGPRALRRWEIKLLPGEAPESSADPARIAALLANYVDPSAIRIWRTAVYRFHALVAQQWRQGPVFLAGDAAHQTPPFFGQGMNSGIRDAANLAWKLLAVEQDGASPALLDSYEAERKPHIRALVDGAKASGLIIGELDPEAAQARDTRLRDVMARGLAPKTRQSLIPDLHDGVLARQDGALAPAAGTLFVQPEVQAPSGWTGLLDDMLDARFLIVAMTPDAEAWLSPEALRIWQRLRGEFVVIQPVGDAEFGSDAACCLRETGTVLRDWMAEQGCRAAVVRPDRYVFGVAADAARLNMLVSAVGRHLYPTQENDR